MVSKFFDQIYDLKNISNDRDGTMDGIPNIK